MIKEIPLAPLHVIGVKDNFMVPLIQINLIEGENREEMIHKLLHVLSDHEVAIIGNTVIKTEAYDAFKII